MDSKFTSQVLFLKKFFEDVFPQTQGGKLLKWKTRGTTKDKSRTGCRVQPGGDRKRQAWKKKVDAERLGNLRLQ